MSDIAKKLADGQSAAFDRLYKREAFDKTAYFVFFKIGRQIVDMGIFDTPTPDVTVEARLNGVTTESLFGARAVTGEDAKARVIQRLRTDPSLGRVRDILAFFQKTGGYPSAE